MDSMSMRSLPGSMRAMEMLSDRCPPVAPPSMAPAPGEPFFTPARLSEPTIRKFCGSSLTASLRLSPPTRLTRK